MGIFGNLFGGKAASMQATIAAQQATIFGMIRGKYEAAQTTSLNKNHWSMADHLSADALLSPEVRRTLRSRGRLEAQNNPYVAGISSRLATGLVGAGPRLRLDIHGANPLDVETVERRFYDWTQDIALGPKMRTMGSCRVTDGDPFAVIHTNKRLRGVQLDLRLVESDQVTDPWRQADPSHVDGIRYDDTGNVDGYYILQEHPGGMGWAAGMMKGKWYDASDVIHWPYLTRPGQHRGVGKIVPALELFAQLRRFVNSTLTAAEVAATFAALMKSTGPGNQFTPEPMSSWDAMPLARGMITALPSGWDFTQLKAEHPNITFAEFVRWILCMACNTCDIPVIVATMDSTGANYSSMRGDYVVFNKHMEVERCDAERVVLDPLLYRWLDEALFIRRYIPGGLPPFQEWNWSWAWDGFGNIDPVKEAAAEQIRLECNSTTLARLYAAKRMNWREEIDQAAIEKAYLIEKGLTVADVAPKTRDAVLAAIQRSIMEGFIEPEATTPVA
jgi:capsid protein